MAKLKDPATLTYAGHTHVNQPTPFCVLTSQCNTGEFAITGPFPTREAAQAYMATRAEEQLASFRKNDPDVPWDLDAEPDGSVATISVNDDAEMEWSVFELIAPTPARPVWPVGPYPEVSSAIRDEDDANRDGVRYVAGDDLWEGATAGWYVFKGGDSEGPYDSEAEAYDKSGTDTGSGGPG